MLTTTKFIDLTVPHIIGTDWFKDKNGNFKRASFNKEYKRIQEIVLSFKRSNFITLITRSNFNKFSKKLVLDKSTVKEILLCQK